MDVGAGFLEQFALILRTHNAGLPRQEKSPATASSHKSLKFQRAAANLRTTSGSRGGGNRQDASIAEEADGPLEGELGQEARATYKKSN